MKISSIIEREGNKLIVISPHANLKAAANLMLYHRTAALVVMQGSEAIGLISERDIVGALSRRSQAAGLVRVKELLPNRFVTVSSEDSIQHAMSIMTFERIHHLPVIDDGTLIGIVSMDDIVRHWVPEFEASVLQDIFSGLQKVTANA